MGKDAVCATRNRTHSADTNVRLARTSSSSLVALAVSVRPLECIAQLYFQDLQTAEAVLLRAIGLDIHNLRALNAYASLLRLGMMSTDSPQERYSRFLYKVCG